MVHNLQNWADFGAVYGKEGDKRCKQHTANINSGSIVDIQWNCSSLLLKAAIAALKFPTLAQQIVALFAAKCLLFNLLQINVRMV